MNSEYYIGKIFFSFLLTFISFFCVLFILRLDLNRVEIFETQTSHQKNVYEKEVNSLHKANLYLEAGQFEIDTEPNVVESPIYEVSDPSGVYVSEKLSQRTTRNYYLLASLIGFLGILLMGGVADLFVDHIKKLVQYLSTNSIPNSQHKINSDFL